MTDIRKETDSLGEVDVAADKLWGAQTQRSLEHFSIGKDLIPRAMNIAAGVNVKQRLIPAVKALHDAVAEKVKQWKDVIKIGRTHMQDATPLTLGQEWSGYQGVLADDLERMEDGLKGVYRLALGGTAVGTGINSAPGLGEAASAEIAKLTGLPFVSAPNKFTVQGAHDALVQLSGTLRTLA